MVGAKLRPKLRQPQTLYFLGKGKTQTRPWSEFLGRENSDHGLSFPSVLRVGVDGGGSQKCRRILTVNFDSEFLGLVFPGIRPPKFHTPNSLPNLPASLSKFTFSNPNLFTPIFCLWGDQDLGRHRVSHFFGGKAPQNSPVTQVSASQLACGLYSEDALRLAKAFPPEKGNPCSAEKN